MNLLIKYGWNEQFQPNTSDELVIGRVTSIQGFKHIVITSVGEVEAELAGKLLYGVAVEELPKLGDWVLLKNYEPTSYILDVLPRSNELSRKNPGKATREQILAANIDRAIIVQGLNRDFNIMRLERYLVQLAACAISPVVLLNKADLISNEQPFRDEIAKLQRNCGIHFCSAVTGTGVTEFESSVFRPGKTYIMIGSSGAGKSSLLNLLMQQNVQNVNTVSDFNSKGKHTTTRRDLFLLPNGSLLIDTPGMREFGLSFSQEESSDDLFPAIAKFASDCRFADCTHTKEMGCAVLQAVESGMLDQAVYESFLKLVREQRRFTIGAEDKKRQKKQWGKITKEAKNYRKKYKY